MVKDKDDEFDEDAISRTGIEIVFEVRLGFQALLFTTLQEEWPELAEDLKEDYEAWIRIETELHKEKGGEASIGDARRRLPGNKWDVFMRKSAHDFPPLSEEMEEKATQEFRERVAQRLRGLDIN